MQAVAKIGGVAIDADGDELIDEGGCIVSRSQTASSATGAARSRPGTVGAVSRIINDAGQERDANLTLASVDALAEVTAKHMRAGRLTEAVSVLRNAQHAYNADAQAHGESPPAMIASCALRLVLCTVLSKGGCHDLAYQEAQAAAATMDEVWGTHLLQGQGIQNDDTGRGDMLREFLRIRPSWLVKGVEVAVQARQCAATELEFMKDWELEDGDDASASSDAALYRRLWEQIAQLHTEAVQIVSQLLEEGHPVRVSAEQTLQNWLERGPEEGKVSATLALPPRATTPVLAGMLAGCGGPAEEDAGRGHGWRMLPPARALPSILPGPPQLPKHERYYRGLPHPQDGKLSRRKRVPMDDSGGSAYNSSSAAQSTTLLDAQASMMSTQPSFSSSSRCASDHVLRGHARKLLEDSPNRSSRRIPIFFNMDGPGGKATWALRGDRKQLQRNAKGTVIKNPFEDYLDFARGPEKTLAMRVTDDENYMAKLKHDYAEQGRLFKNYWMRYEVEPEHLLEDRIRFTETGISVHKKVSKLYPRTDPRSRWPELAADRVPLSTLFKHYGVKHEKSLVSKSEPGLRSLSTLLSKSNAKLMRSQAREGRAVEKPKPPPEERKKSKGEPQAEVQPAPVGGKQPSVQVQE